MIHTITYVQVLKLSNSHFQYLLRVMQSSNLWIIQSASAVIVSRETVWLPTVDIYFPSCSLGRYCIFASTMCCKREFEDRYYPGLPRYTRALAGMLYLDGPFFLASPSLFPYHQVAAYNSEARSIAPGNRY